MASHKVSTFAGRSKFDYDDNLMEITLSTGSVYRIEKEVLRVVKERYEKLPLQLRTKASQYTDPKWTDCPNRIFAPAIAKLIYDDII